MSRKPRKNYSPKEKVTILRKLLIDHVPLSDLCDQYQLQPQVVYRWQKEFFEHGEAAFEQVSKRPTTLFQQKIEALETKLARKNEVLSELMEAHVQLKKELGEP
ncbi:MAG: helix-turn-helix domain-containing protein [Terriglobia bacterium]|jgi:transposase